MKKVLIALLTLCIAASITAYNIIKEKTNSDSSVDITVQNSEANNVVTFNNCKVTAINFEELPTDIEGMVQINVDLEIENTTSHSLQLFPRFNAYADDIKSSEPSYTNSIFLDNLAPNKKIIKKCTFEVPEDWKKFEIEITDLGRVVSESNPMLVFYK